MLAVPLGALFINCALTFLLVSEQQQAQTWVTHTLDVRVSLGRIRSDMSDAAVGMSSYRITQKREYWQSAERARIDLPIAIRNLQRLTADNPRQQVRIDSLKHDSRESMDFLFQPPSPQGNQLQLPSPVAQGLAARRAISNTLAEFDAEEISLQNLRSQKLERIQEWLQILGPATLACGIAGGLIGIWLFLTGIEEGRPF